MRIGPATLLVAGFCLSCGNPPTAPREEGVHFLYIDGQTVLAPGETAQLSALEMRSGRPPADVTSRARWATTDPSVATIQQGLLRAVFPGTSTISADFEASGSTEVRVVLPSAAPADVRGTFSGTVTFTGCVRTAGEGPSPCRDWVGRTFPLELTLSDQTNASVAGTLLVIERTQGAVRGYVDFSGALVLSGTLGIAGEPLARMIRHLRLQIDGRQLSGHGNSDVAAINAFGPQLTKESFEVAATVK